MNRTLAGVSFKQRNLRARRRRAFIQRAVAEELESRRYLALPELLDFQQNGEYEYEDVSLYLPMSDPDPNGGIAFVDIDWGAGEDPLHYEADIDFLTEDWIFYGGYYNDNPSPSDPYYHVTITVTDVSDESDTFYHDVTVSNYPPLSSLIPSTGQTANEGTTVTYAVQANDLSSADNAAGLRYSIATTEGALAGNYATAGTSNTTTRFLDDNGTAEMYSRTFDKDNGAGHSGVYIYVANVAPFATLTYSDPDSNGNVTVSLANANDPSSADTAAGFRYSFNTNYDNLAGSYTSAGTSSSQVFTEAQLEGGATVYARIFDKDNGPRNYQVGTTDLSAQVVSSNQVNLTWTDNITNELGWRIQWSFDGTNFNNYLNLSGDHDDYEFTGLPDGTRVWFRARAFSDATHPGESIYSPKMAQTTYLPKASGVSADRVKTDQITLHWNDNSQNEAGFKIFQSADGGAFSLVATINGQYTGSGPLSYDIDNLAPSAFYTFTVGAFNNWVTGEENPSLPAAVTTLSNDGPILIHGPTSAETGEFVQLWTEGGGSGTLTRYWEVKSAGVTVASGKGADFAFHPTSPGTYELQLTVFSGATGVVKTHLIEVRPSAVRTIEIDRPAIAVQGRAATFAARVDFHDPIFEGLDLTRDVSFEWTVQQGTGTAQPQLSSGQTFTFVPDVDGEHTIRCSVKLRGDVVLEGNALISVVEPGSPSYTAAIFDLEGNTQITSEESVSQTRDAIELPDGKIVALIVEGNPFINTSTQEPFGILRRYNPDLTVDTTWGTDGNIYISLPPWESPYKFKSQGNDGWIVPYGKMALLDDGKILVAGGFRVHELVDLDTINDWYVARYNADGSLDTTFGDEGYASTYDTALHDSLHWFVDLAVQPDGGILLGGAAHLEGGNEWYEGTTRSAFAVVRFDSEGNLDTDFGNGQGAAIIRMVDDDYVNLPAGVIDDMWFGSTGDQSPESVISIAIQPDGDSFKIIAGGVASRNGHDPNTDLPASVDENWEKLAYFETLFAMVRLDSDGLLDTDFGDAGKTLTLGPDVAGHIVDLGLANDGGIFAIGSVIEQGVPSFDSPDFVNAVNYPNYLPFFVNDWMYAGGIQRTMVARYDADGAIDTDWGTDGMVIHDYDSGSSLGDGAVTAGAFVDSSDRIVFAGSAMGAYDSDFNFYTSPWPALLARLNPDGSKDTTFPTGANTNGRIFMEHGESPDSSLVNWTGVFQSKVRGDIVVFGDSLLDPPTVPYPYVDHRSIIARYSIFDPAIQNLTARERSDGTVELLWTYDGSDEDGFSIYRGPDDDGPWTLIGRTGVDQTTYIDALVEPNQEYWYKVAAFRADEMGELEDRAFSDPVQVFTRPPDSAYVLQEVLVFSEQDLSTGASIESIFDMEPGVAYRLRASGSFLLGPWPNGDMTRADAEYAYLYAGATDGPLISLDDYPGQINDPGRETGKYGVSFWSQWFRKYGVDYGIKFGTGPTDSLARQGPFWGEPSADGVYTITYYHADDPSPLSLYYNDNHVEDNAYVNNASPPERYFPAFGDLKVEIYRPGPSAPTRLTATANRADEQIELAWKNFNEDNTARLIVERSDDDGGFVPIAIIPGDAVRYVDNDVDLGHRYAYRVKVVNEFAESGYSNTSYAVLINQPPVISRISPQFVAANSEFTLQIDASDPEDDTAGLEFAVMNPPSGMTPTSSAHNTTGLISGWTPGDSLVGQTFPLQVRVWDADGGSTDQYFTVTVGPPPQTIPSISTINSTPLDDSRAQLSAVATDDGGEENLIYDWSVVKKPNPSAKPVFSADGTHAAAQTIVTFDTAGIYVFKLNVADGTAYDGESTKTITVSQVESGMSITPAMSWTRENGPRVLSAFTVDQFGDPMDTQPATINWSITDGPGSLSSSTGASTTYTVTSIPSDDEATIEATASGTTHSATATIGLLSSNAAPQIEDMTVTAISTSRVMLTVRAGDLDDEESGLTYFWDASSGPSGATTPVFEPINGTNAAKQIFVDVDPTKPIAYTFSVTVTDPAGATGDDELIVTEAQHLTRIMVATPSQVVLPDSGTVTFSATPQDLLGREFTAGTVTYAWSVDGDPVSGVTGSQYVFTVPEDVGVYKIEVSGTNGTDNASGEILLSVVEDADAQLEIVMVGGYGDGVEADAAVTIRGSNPFGDDIDWYLWLRSSNDMVTLLGSGDASTNLAPMVAATLKPAMLGNGLYTLELTTDDQGQVVHDRQTLEIRSQVKLGGLTLPVTDLSVDLPNGGSITVTRVYDSARADELGDFGYGWKLLLEDTSLTTTSKAGSYGNAATPALRHGDLVYITLPDGGQRAFQFIPRPLSGYGQYTPQFISVDGSRSTLMVAGDVHDVSDDVVLNLKPGSGEFTAIPITGSPIETGYNPIKSGFGGGYTLTTVDGTKYAIDGDGKITSAFDANGNKVFDPVPTTAGQYKLKIDPNLDGYIETVSIVDADTGVAIEGIGEVNYAYDGNDRLTTVTGQDGNETEYAYGEGGAPSRLLTGVTDSRGVKVLAAEYNAATGELRKLTDSSGAAAPISTNTSQGTGGNMSQAVSDPAGGQTEVIYDSRGNAIREIKAEVNDDGSVTGYLVTARQYLYAIDTDPAEIASTGITIANTLSLLKEYAPFKVAANGNRYTSTPPQLLRTVIYSLDRDDSLGLPVSETVYDINGTPRTTEYSDYVLGKPQIVKDSFGQYTYLKYDDKGNLEWTINALGEGTRHTYSTPYYATSTIYTYDDTTTVDIDDLPQGLLLESFRIKVDQWGNDPDVDLPTVEDVSGTPDVVNKYYLNTDSNAGNRGRIKSATSAAGQKTIYAYDKAGRTVLTATLWENPANGTGAGDRDRWVVSRTVYDAAGRGTESKQAVYEDAYASGGASVNDGDFAWSLSGADVAVNEPFLSGWTAERTLSETIYDDAGQVWKTIDQYGGITENVYDARGQSIQTLYPDGTQTRTVYDAMGRVIWASDRNTAAALDDGSLATHTVYDSLGRVITTERYQNVVIEIDDDDVNAGLFVSIAPSRQSLIDSDKLSTNHTNYDDNGRVGSTIDASGLKTESEYYDNGRLKRTRQVPDGGSATAWTTYEYDLIDNLPAGAIRYDKVTDALEHVTKTYKDALGRVIRTTFHDSTYTQALYGVGTDPVTGHTVSGQTITGRQETRIDQLGNATDYFYDESGRLVAIYLPEAPDALNGNTLTRPDWHYTYDQSGNQLSQEDPKGNITSFAYDEFGRRISRTLPAVNSVTVTENWTYDGFGRTLTHSDFKGQTTAYLYDDTISHGGRLIGEYRFAAGIAAVTSAGEVNTIAALEHTLFGYDDLGRQTVIVDTTADAHLLAHWEFEESGSQSTAIDSSGNGHQGTYTSTVDREVTSERGYGARFDSSSDRATIPDAPALRVGGSDADFTVSFRIKVTEDPSGWWRSIMSKGNADTDRTFAMWLHPNDNRVHYRISTTNSFNEGGDSTTALALNQWTLVTYVKRGNTLELWLDGELDSQATLAGSTLSNTGDFVIGQRYGYTTTGAVMDDVRIYDIALSSGQIEAMASDGEPNVRVETMQYDPLTGNVSQVSSPEGSINYEYDPATGRNTRTYTDHNDTSYDYDSFGRLWHVTSNMLDGTVMTSNNVTTYTYDAVGNLDTAEQPNGVVTDYDYDDLNRLDLLTTSKSNGNKLFEQDYILLDNGQRDSVTEKRYDGNGNDSGNIFSTVVIDWEYDDNGRLTEEHYDQDLASIGGNESTDDYVDTYTFDLVGNRITKSRDVSGTDEMVSYVYDARDRLSSEDSNINANDKTYSYDENGSQTKVVDGSSNTTLYLWDLRNRMVAVDGNGDDLSFDSGTGATSGTVNDSSDALYGYDGDGQRVSQRPGDSSTSKYYVNDRVNPTGYPQILEERSGATPAGAVLERSYVLGQRVEGQSDSGNGTLYFLRDGHGSNRGVVNGSAAVVDRYDYRAFGEAIGFNPNSAKTIHLFGGDAEYDPASSFYYHDKRWRATHRFVSFDEFEAATSDPMGLHKYHYSTNNPVNFNDPSGMFALGDSSLAGFATGLRGPSVSGILDVVREMIPSMDWSLDGMSLSDAAFELAGMHQLISEIQIDGVGVHLRSEYGRILAANRFAFAMTDFLQDFVYIDPMQLALGWFGARACFVAGTQVVVGIAGDGSYIMRNIEDLQEGDMVLARDQYDANDELDLRPVVQVFRKVSDHLRVLQIRGRGGNVETIETTDEHPFWVEGIGWVRAGDLRVGMEVDQPDGSNAMLISTVFEAHPEGIAVYNFEVAGDHTYFVEDGQGGQTAIWVHNTCARRLWRNMKKAGFAAAKKFGHAAHHIIARAEHRWDEAIWARDKFNSLLAGATDGLNEFFNGVILDPAYHAKLNGPKYYKAVWAAIKDIDQPVNLIAKLIEIGDELAAKSPKYV